jgi:hypothetical protein
LAGDGALLAGFLQPGEGSGFDGVLTAGDTVGRGDVVDGGVEAAGVAVLDESGDGLPRGSMGA